MPTRMILPENQIVFDQPYPFADVDDRDEALCSTCGVESYPWPAEELIAIKHTTARHSRGAWRIYCPEHVLKASISGLEEAPAKASSTKSRATSGTRSRAASAPVVPERPLVTCVNCFVVVPPSGVCGVCGEPAS